GGFGASSAGVQYAQITVTLKEKEALLDKVAFWKKHEEQLRPINITAEVVSAQLLQKIRKVTGAQVSVNAVTGFGFGSAIQLAFKSNDRALLTQTTLKVQEGLASGAIEGVVN